LLTVAPVQQMINGPRILKAQLPRQVTRLSAPPLQRQATMTISWATLKQAEDYC
jgi:hypothetical protein